MAHQNVAESPIRSKKQDNRNFGIPPTNINCTDYMLPFKLLYRDFDSLAVSNLDKDFVKSRYKGPAFSSYKNTGKILEMNLPKVEFDALKITP